MLKQLLGRPYKSIWSKFAHSCCKLDPFLIVIIFSIAVELTSLHTWLGPHTFCNLDSFIAKERNFLQPWNGLAYKKGLLNLFQVSLENWHLRLMLWKFSSLIINGHNKLECLSLASLSSPVLISSGLGLAPTLLANIRLGWKGLPGTKTLSYLTHLVVTKKKKVYYIRSWCQCYKTFYGCNLQLFVIS
jgi:hypothetical protein